KEWGDVEEVDRIGLDREFYEILGLKVPHVTIPVRPGRDMARLIEVAAMDAKLKGLGQNAAVDFNTRLLRLMEQQRATYWDCCVVKESALHSRRIRQMSEI